MAKQFKVYIFRKAFSTEVMNSDNMTAYLKEYANDVVNRCGEGYACKVRKGSKRAVATVHPETAEAYFDNMKHNTLLKAGGV